MDESKMIKDSVSAALIQNVINNIPNMAKLIKGAYNALVREGFSEVQALQIVITRGFNL